jgi:hypothetical protein
LPFVIFGMRIVWRGGRQHKNFLLVAIGHNPVLLDDDGHNSLADSSLHGAHCEPAHGVCGSGA